MKASSTLYGLSAGRINLKTGQTKYFNIFENNQPTDSLVLVKSGFSDYTVVSGAGQGYESFVQGNFMDMLSQTRLVKRGQGVSVHPCTPEGLSQIKDIIGVNKCSFWVFK
jgi:hypothetical protein